MRDSVAVYSRTFSAIVNRSDLSRLSKVYSIPDHIVAPATSATPVGEISYEVDGKKIGKSELFIKEGVEKIGVLSLLWRILRTAALGESKNQ